MDQATLRYKAMRYEHPEEIPVSIGVLPAAWLRYETEMRELAKRFPQFFGWVTDEYDFRANIPRTYRLGEHIDEWGCVWSNMEEGMEAIVTGHPVPNRADILTLEIPPNHDGRLPHGFMYLRLLDLRGFEEAMLDFAEECDELQILIDKVTTYNCLQVEAVVQKAGPVMHFGDDLGMQKGLAIGPAKWRQYMKPSFTKIYDIAHREGRLVYMHTDGMIYEIIPDLFDAGVNMVNPQIRANGLQNLVDVCKGRYPMDLDLDRQLFPFCTPADCREHVRECVEALYMPAGGLALRLEIGHDVPIENAEALFTAVDCARFYGTEKFTGWQR